MDSDGSTEQIESARSSLIEGFGNEVVQLLTVLFALAIPTIVWTWRNRHHALLNVHPAQLGLVQDVRRRLGFAEAADAEPGTATEAPVQNVPPNIPRYQLDNTCPICYGVSRFAVLTNCGHRFCTNCIITYWRVGRWIGNAVECPVCRNRVTLLLPEFFGTATEEETDPDGRNQAVADIREYNRRFSGMPRPLLDYLRDAPVLLRHLWQQLFTMGGLMMIFRLRIIICVLVMLGYVLSPLDILPEAAFGMLGLIDDLFIIGMALFYMVTLYRHYVGQGNFG